MEEVNSLSHALWSLPIHVQNIMSGRSVSIYIYIHIIYFPAHSDDDLLTVRDTRT